MRSAKAAYVALPLLVTLLGVLLLWQLSARSTIPTSLNGTVVSVRSADEHPGTDNAWFVRVGDRTHQVDREVGRLLRAGDRVEKKVWDDSLRINGVATDVRYSDDARAAALSWSCARLSRRRVS